MHVLIIGFGKTAKHLADQLLMQGHQVTGISRSIQCYTGVHCVAQSVHDADYRQLAPIDWVYVLLTPDERSEQSYKHIFIDSIQPISLALQLHPVQRIVFISSTSVYGKGQGELMDESTKPVPDTATGNVLLQAEQLWKSIWHDKLTVVRPSGIYGPQSVRLIRWVQEGKPVALNQWTNRVHIHDLAAILARLSATQHIADIYLVTDHLPVLQEEVLDGIADLLGVSKVLKQQAAVSGKKLVSTRLSMLGYTLCYPTWREGYAAIISQIASSPRKM